MNGGVEPRLTHAVELFQTVEYSRRRLVALGPALPAVLLATAGVALGVAVARRVLPRRYHSLIEIALGAWQALTVVRGVSHETTAPRAHPENTRGAA